MDTDAPGVSVPKLTAIQLNLALPGQWKLRPRPKALKYASPSAAMKPQKTIVKGLAAESKCSPQGTLLHPQWGEGSDNSVSMRGSAPLVALCEDLPLHLKQQFLCMHFDLIMAV